MPENPIYNPNNIVRKEPIPVYNPNNIVKKEVVDTRVFSEDPNVKMPEYTTPKDLEIDNAINFIDKQAIESGRIALTEERKGVLKDVLKNPNATKEQKEQAILTMQGYDKDTSGDVSNKFYMQQDSNGVYVPKLLKHGQRPPKGTAINSFHGTQADANDDAWYTDLSKSLANGLVEAAGGVVDLAQAGQQLVTGEESEILNDARNSVDFFKFKKDEDLNKSIYNTEGITKWADLLDKDRIDITPSALWGTFNGLTESLSEFGFGTMVGGSLIKGVKAAKYGLQGVEKVVELGSAAQKSAIVFGSTIAQLGDVMDAAKEAGLKGRDASAFALTTATAMGAIDAMTGLEGKVMSDLFKRSKKQILKNAIKTVGRDVNGNITPEAFKELAKRTSIQYGEMARNAGKEIVKDAVGEGTQEAIQDFTQKAAENLWDKMTPDERGQFGTDAFDAKSFGSYLNSFATGAFTGIPMALQQQAFRKKNEEQSVHIYDRIKQGEEAIKALKIDLHEALVNNDINQSEYDQAIFKIDSYDKYHQETKNVNLKPEDEKKAFELSFQIQGLKTEIPTNENEISKLDPIARAKVESKQKQAKELQSELNDIIRRGEIKGEPVVPKKEEERIQKEKEKEIKTEETNSKLSQEEPVVKEKEVVKKGVIVQPKLSKQPHWKDDTRSYDDVDVDTFNNQAFDARSKFRMVVEKLDKEPSKEASALLIKRPYKYWDGEKWKTGDVIEAEFADGKRIRTASSKKLEAGYRGWFRQERTLGNEEGLPVGVKVIDLNNPRGEQVGEDYVPGRKILKIYDKRTGKFLSWAKETKLGKLDALDKNDQILTTQEQGEFIKTLEQLKYNEKPSDEGEISEIIKPKPKPTPTEKAAEATEQIVKESKEKVKQEKQNNKQQAVDKNRKENIDRGYELPNGDKIIFKIKNEKLNNIVPINGKKLFLGIGGRFFTLVNINGKNIPFYMSSEGTSGKKAGGWYPFFGTASSNGNLVNWIVKGSLSEMENGYGNKAIKEVMDNLNENLIIPTGMIHYDGTLKGAEGNIIEDLNKHIEFGSRTFGEDWLENSTEINKKLGMKVPSEIIGHKSEGVDEYINSILNNIKNESGNKEIKEDNKALGLKIKRKVEGYNRLSFEQKKTDFGVNLRKEIDKDVKEFGGSLKPLNRNNIQLLDSEGKQVKKDSVRREQSVIDNEKAIAIKKKNALNTTPTSIPQYLAMVIGSKGQFAESLTKEIPNVPSMMKDFKKGYTLESLLQGYKDRANLTDESISESDFNSEAMDFLKEYLIEGGRDLAIKYAVESYEKEVNGGYTDKQIKELEDYAKANGVTEEELSDIKEVAQNVNNEEYKTITEKIESKNENERNEQLADEIKNDYFGDENGINDIFIKDESKKSEEEKDITRNESEDEPFQKESGKPSVYSQKVIDKLQKALPKVKIVFDANLKAAGKWSPSTNTITINPEYAGKDTAIHEVGHILIDAMGYENKIIQQAVKQLRGTDLYTETKDRYPELNEEQLDKEVLAEAIGREGADIFDKVADKSKFMTYLDYIFNWLKQKLGLDKNVAKSLAKQIIGGIKTKELKGTAGEEQLQKEKPKKKNPIGVKPLTFAQYAVEHGFSYEAETNKMEEALVNLQEATDEMESAREDAENAKTDEEAEVAEKVLAEKETVYKEARKAYAIAGKRTFEYKKYKKDFNAIQEVLKEKDLSKYTVEELQDLIAKIHGFDDRAAKSVKEEAMLKLAFLVRKEIQAIHSERDNYIESVADSKDITPLQKMLLHISHFTEYQPEMQKLSLEFGKAVMDKISDASTRKGIHEKLAQKVIAEENKKLGITGAALTRFSSDSAKYFEWMVNEDGNLLTVEEAQKKGLSEAKINYLKFTRETIADYKEDMSKDNFENVVMEAIKVDKGFQEAFKSEGLLEAFSYYLGGGGYNLGKVRIEHNGTIKSYAEIEKEILSKTDKKSITSILSGLWELLKANVKARRQLKKGYNVDESVNPLEIKTAAEYTLNNKGQLVSKFDKPRSKDRGYSKDFYRAMNQFIDESAHVKHMSKIMPLVESVEYLNKKGYMEKGIQPKKNVAKWIEDWKALHIFKEPHVNDPVLDASIKLMRKLVASTTMWFNIPANTINVLTGNYNNWRQENGKTIAKGNARLFGGKGERGGYGVVNKYALDIIKKYNIVNQDFDSQPTLRANNIFAKMATIGTQLGEYQIQGSLALGLMPDNVYNSFEYKKDKYGNDVLVVKDGVNEDEIKKEILKVKNRVTDIQGKYPDEDRRNIMRGEFGKAIFQFKVWMPDWFRERFAPEYYNAFGERKEGTLRALYKDGFKKIKDDLKSGNFKELAKNKAFMSNLKGLMVITALLAYKYQDDDDDEVRGKITMADNLLGQVLFIMDPEQDKYMVSNPVAALGKTKDFINAAEAIITLDEKAWDKTKRVLPANKLSMAYDLGKKIIE